MKSYSIRPNVFLQVQDIHLNRARSVQTPFASTGLADDLACLRALVAGAAAAFGEAWAAARARRATVQQLKPMDQRLLADVGVDYPNLREIVDAMTAQSGEIGASAQPVPEPVLRTVVRAGA